MEYTTKLLIADEALQAAQICARDWFGWDTETWTRR